MNSDPTYAQINTTYNWLCWAMPTAEARAAAQYMKTKTRREVSNEMSRLQDLRKEHNLTRDTAFQSKFWEGYFKRT